MKNPTCSWCGQPIIGESILTCNFKLMHDACPMLNDTENKTRFKLFGSNLTSPPKQINQ